MAKFSKCHYEAIADVLGCQLWKAQIDGKPTTPIFTMVYAFTDYFERTQPRFKADRFQDRVVSWKSNMID